MLKNKKICKAVLAGMMFTALPLFAENIDVKSLVSSTFYNELIKDGLVARYRDNGSNELLLIPDSYYSEKIKNSMIKKEPKNYPYTYEGLYLLNKKKLLSNSGSNKSDITIDDVSKVVRSVSKMQGMTYYSTTKKKECVLYDKAYMIAGPGDERKIDDQNEGNADGQISYCLQNDNSFGKNTYKLSYFQNGNTLLCQFGILDKMGIGPFNAIYPGKMVINILVIDCGEELLLYLNTDLDSIKFPGIKGQITDSMSSRMDAVYKWFITQF